MVFFWWNLFVKMVLMNFRKMVFVRIILWKCCWWIWCLWMKIWLLLWFICVCLLWWCVGIWLCLLCCLGIVILNYVWISLFFICLLLIWWLFLLCYFLRLFGILWWFGRWGILFVGFLCFFVFWDCICCFLFWWLLVWIGILLLFIFLVWMMWISGVGLCWFWFGVLVL